MDKPIISDIMLRQYFAAVIGPARSPFGQRSTKSVSAIGEPTQIAQNSTRDKALFVTVSRADVSGTVTVIFSQQPASGSINDFVVAFAPTSSFHFVLRPDETVSMQILAAPAPMILSVGTESY